MPSVCSSGYNRCENATGCIVHPSFTPVRDAFRENFAMNWESSAAAFAVYHKGELVADLYGGYSDPVLGLPWSSDTQSILFSVTKSLAATCLAILIDQNKASYDDLVCKYWPEFVSNGKQHITIKQIVQHQAGLPYGSENFTVDDVNNHERMSKLLERMSPQWQPGTKCGYHALTFGFLVDQIVRRLDDKKRGVVQYFNDEIVSKYDLDELSIGLINDEQNKKVARIIEPSSEQIQYEAEYNPEGVKRFNLTNNIHYMKLYKNWEWIKISGYNKIENRRLPMPSNMGMGTARAVAKFHSLIAEGNLLSKSFLDQIKSPDLIDTMDIVNGYRDCIGYGWFYTKNSSGNWIFGHSGYGGQNVRVDIDSKLAYAYICNGLKASDSDYVKPFSNLQNALYKCI